MAKAKSKKVVCPACERIKQRRKERMERLRSDPKKLAEFKQKRAERKKLRKAQRGE